MTDREELFRWIRSRLAEVDADPARAPEIRCQIYEEVLRRIRADFKSGDEDWPPDVRPGPASSAPVRLVIGEEHHPERRSGSNESRSNHPRIPAPHVGRAV